MYYMPKSQSSPHEELRYSNFPEVATLEPQLNEIEAYMEKVNSAIVAFETKKTKKVHLNIAELKTVLDLTYEVTDILGRADNVCYDVLLNMRTYQEALHDLLYLSNSEGTRYVDFERSVDSTEITAEDVM